jgi:hypothetical protein
VVIHRAACGISWRVAAAVAVLARAAVLVEQVAISLAR